MARKQRKKQEHRQIEHTKLHTVSYRAGECDCLRCGKRWNSPDKVCIRICPKCKTANSYVRVYEPVEVVVGRGGSDA